MYSDEERKQDALLSGVRMRWVMRRMGAEPERPTVYHHGKIPSADPEQNRYGCCECGSPELCNGSGFGPGLFPEERDPTLLDDALELFRKNGIGLEETDAEVQAAR